MGRGEKTYEAPKIDRLDDQTMACQNKILRCLSEDQKRQSRSDESSLKGIEQGGRSRGVGVQQRKIASLAATLE